MGRKSKSAAAPAGKGGGGLSGGGLSGSASRKKKGGKGGGGMGPAGTEVAARLDSIEGEIGKNRQLLEELSTVAAEVAAPSEGYQLENVYAGNSGGGTEQTEYVDQGITDAKGNQATGGALSIPDLGNLTFDLGRSK